MKTHPAGHGHSPDAFSIVLQYHMRDLDDAIGTDILRNELNPGGAFPEFESSVVGDNPYGVFDALKACIKQILTDLQNPG